MQIILDAIITSLNSVVKHRVAGDIFVIATLNRIGNIFSAPFFRNIPTLIHYFTNKSR